MFRLARTAVFVVIISIWSCSIASAEKAFQNDQLSAQALRLAQDIKNSSGAVPPALLPQLRKDGDAAVTRQNWVGAISAYGKVVSAVPNDCGTWFKLALTTLKVAPNGDGWMRSILASILSNPADGPNRPQTIKRAITIAYISYQCANADNDEANSLILLGVTTAELANWDVALDVLRRGLDLRKVDVVDARYQQLLAQHGFRVTGYTVQPDAVAPSACFLFSEALSSKHIDFGNYVSVVGQPNLPVSTTENQLCVEGLSTGKRYKITIRSGLPSDATEKLGDYAKLSKDASFDIYMSDRQPTVRFTGRSYVLPRSGQQGIPIVSVNADTILIKIYRIGDRNIIEAVNGAVMNGSFKNDLSSSDGDQIRDQYGVLVWSGSMTSEIKLNTEVTTAFPIDQAVPKLEAGVYVMTAKPDNSSLEDTDKLATQWFVVSDLGLSALSGQEGITASVNSLASTQPVSGVEVRLLARNNEVLASRTTDSNGVVQFEAGLARGKGGLSPGLLVALHGDDYAFLNLMAPAFDLSDRGISGRTAPSGLDAFVYTERGVYRTGETVYVTTLLRDTQGVAVLGTPLTVVIERPDGIEFLRKVVEDQGVGGRSLNVDIPPAALTGTWRVSTYVDPKGPPVGQTTFLVDDYIPDRLDFILSSTSTDITDKTPAIINLEGHFLYGAPAANLDIDGDINIVTLNEWAGFPGYHFGLASDDTTGEKDTNPIEGLPQTDAQGKSQLSVPLTDAPDPTRLQQAIISIRLSDPGGRAVEHQMSFPIVPASPMIGIRPLFAGQSVADGDTANFDVILVSPDGKPQAAPSLHWQLIRVENQYQSYKDQFGSWTFEAVKSTHQVNSGQIDLTGKQPGRISLPLHWGRYRLEIKSSDPSGPVTSVAFDAGFYADATSETPDLLETAVDKQAYRVGDPLTVSVTARTAGKLTVAIVGNKLLTAATVDVQPGTARVPFTVGNDWGSGAYVLATLRRPLDVPASRMPGRSIGVQWFSVDRTARTLTVNMQLPDIIRPLSTLRVPLSIDGLAAGEDARVVVAAVDVGILNLTNYKSPAPDDYLFGQRRMSMEIRDLYGQLIDGMQGTRGPIRTGGGESAELLGPPPTQPPLALYSGLVKVGPDGKAEVNFKIPDFTGTIRLMAVAWSKNKVGQASADVIARDPVVVSATLPRFLLIGDRSTLRVDIDNVEAQTGDYNLVITGDPIFKIDNPSKTIRLGAGQRDGVGISLSALSAGTGNILTRVTGPGGLDLRKTYTLSVKPATQIAMRRTIQSIAPQGTLTLTTDLLADYVPGTASVALSIGPSTTLDAATLSAALRRYPFDCSEQLTSRALPLLYAGDLQINQTENAIAINQAISQLLMRQSPEGSFSSWPVAALSSNDKSENDSENSDSNDNNTNDDIWLDAYVTDFLTRARERGYNVSNVAFKLALDHLQNQLSIISDVNKADLAQDGANLAYIYYVLARNKMAPVSDLKTVYQDRLAEVPTPMARAQIAAALAMLGNRAEADGAFNSADLIITGRPALSVGRTDYGSDLRDEAAAISLAADNGALNKVTNAVVHINDVRNSSLETTTNENAWMLMAARGLANQGPAITLQVSGVAHNGPIYRQFIQTEIATGVQVVNSGDQVLKAVVSVSGNPTRSEPAVSTKGLQIERRYYTADGTPADITKARQNQRFVVVLQITEARPQFGHLIISDYLPAGFEIDNPDLVSTGKTNGLTWISHPATTVSSQFRDDRFTAAVDRNTNDDPTFAIAYVARAVSPGHYAVPQARVEDMYRTDRYGRTSTEILDITATR
jgi:uncharacterized protein YfaS (alpha-2-macroglobulin family)